MAWHFASAAPIHLMGQGNHPGSALFPSASLRSAHAGVVSGTADRGRQHGGERDVGAGAERAVFAEINTVSMKNWQAS